MAAANNPFGAPSAPAVNPFAKPIQAAQPAQTTSVFGNSSAPSQNPFGKSIFAQAQSTVPSACPSPFAQNPFAKPVGRTNSAGGNKSPFFGVQNVTQQQSTGFGAANTNNMKGSQGFGGGKPSGTNNGFGNSQASQMFGKGKATTRQQLQKPGGRDAGATLANKFQRGQRKSNESPAKTQPNATRAIGSKSTSGAPTREPTERTRELSEFAYSFHNKINEQLKKDHLKPPQWPTTELGNPNKRDDVENLKQSYKKYRTRVYDALRKVELIDDPEKRRKLEDALPFKGICEDMCPEFEQISRIAEFDVKNEEKEPQPDGLTAWPEPSKMVKKFGRSAAGQDAPLPMDVRSIDALRRTTDYLFNGLLQSENNLPSMHNYLWDRTRAVRKDFTFHSQKSAEEMKDMVYCFETITRFHATALHLLSRKGFANEDFEQKQEIEQLGRTILSLMEAYDVCKEKHVLCENEAEFRAYYLLLNAHDPSIAQRIRTWGKEYWFDSEEIQTALSLIQVMEDLREPKGPIKPRRMTTMSDTAFTNFFAMVEDPRVSYTMACVAEVHFTFVRQCILKNLARAYARQRDAPRTITASDLNKMLRFDTAEEAVAFAEEHNFEFTTWVPPGKPAVPEPYLLLNNKRKHVPSPRVPQSYSGQLVERKRAGQSLPYVIYNTIYEEVAENTLSARDSDANGGGLFVNPQQALPAFSTSQVNKPQDVATSPFASMFGATPPITKAHENTPVFQTSVKDFGALNHPFTKSTATNLPQATGATGATTSNPFSCPSPAHQPQGAANPFSMFGQPSAASPVTQPSSSASAPAPKPTSVFAPASQTPQPAFSFGQPQAATPFSSSSVAPAPAADTPKSTILEPPARTTSIFGSGTAPANPFTSRSSQNTSTAPAKPSETTQQTSSGITFTPTAPVSKPRISFTANPGTEQQQASTPAGPTQTELPGTPSVISTISSVFSAPPKPVESMTPAQPAAQPSTVFAPQNTSNPPFGTKGTPNDGSTSSLFTTTPLLQPSQSTFAPSQPTAPPRDLMGDFAKWFVMGDGGLLEEFTAHYLQELAEGAFNQHLKEEAERRRREEDEQSWKEARAHMKDRLQLKYFYRWREAARKLAQRRILREGKEKMRLYREQEQRAKKKKKQDEEMMRDQERLEAKRRIQADGSRLKQLALNAAKVGRSQQQVEEDLLASGVFSGVRDERAAVRRAIKEAAANGDWGTPQPGKRYGYGSEAGFEVERAPSRTRNARSLRGSMTGSPESTASKEGGKTRALREKFGLRGPRGSFSSVGGSSVQSSMITKFQHSLNGIGANGENSMIKRASNLSTPRKRSIDPSPATEGRDPKQPRRSMLGMSMANTSLPNISLRQGASANSPKPNGFKTSHWDLRARGLVPMPDGQWLPEAIATAIKEGKLKPPRPPTGNQSYSPAVRPSTEHAILSDDDESMGMGSTYNDNGDDAEVDDSASMASWRLRVARLTGAANPIPSHLQQTPLKQSPADYSTSGRLAKLKARMGYGSPAANNGPVSPLVRQSPTPSAASASARPFSRREASWSAILDRKRKRGGLAGSEAEASFAAPSQERPENSPPLAKKAYKYAASAISGRSTTALSTREETNAAVEETQRMLRELRETMDKLDNDKVAWREEISGGGQA